MVRPSPAARIDDDVDLSKVVSADEPPVAIISDELYAESLQLQEVLASFLKTSIDDEAPPHRQLLHDSPASSSTQWPLTCLPATPSTIWEVGQSSNSNSTICDICAESKTRSEMFDNKKCPHLFCRECMVRHIEAKVGDNICEVLCPEANCGGVLDPLDCRELVGEHIFERWGRVLCESTLHRCRRSYCPYKNCSAPFILDDFGADGGEEEEITQAECGSCWRLFCAKCSVPWHAGMSCEEFQSLDPDERARDDIMLMELAESKHWKRCPSCRFVVERTEGCLHMVCRCKFEFCYACGEEWSTRHLSCHT